MLASVAVDMLWPRTFFAAVVTAHRRLRWAFFGHMSRLLAIIACHWRGIWALELSMPRISSEKICEIRGRNSPFLSTRETFVVPGWAILIVVPVGLLDGR